MSLFGEYLKELIDANSINIYALAKSAGLERTAIHKFMTGGRLPSDDYAKKLADALPLSPEEHRRLLESYDISKIGVFKYKQRIQVKNIIESLAYMESGAVHSSSYTVSSPPPEASGSTAAGYFAVNNLVRSVIEEAVAQSGDQWIDFVVPENYQYFYNELLACYIRHPALRIRHIIAFTKKVDFVDNTNRNLGLLSQVLPLAFAPGAEYSPYYFYQTSEDVEITQAMPYFILTSANKLLLLNRDFSKAIFISDTDIVDVYKESFASMLPQTKVLLNRVNSMYEYLQYYTTSDFDNLEEPTHWIEPEPCIGTVVDDDLIARHVKDNMPYRDETIALLCKHYGYYKNNKLHNIDICTTEGLSDFIDTGYTFFSPHEVVEPFSRDTVKELLLGLKNRIVDKKMDILFTNPSKIALPGKVIISINRSTGICLMNCKNDNSDLRVIILSEESINLAFSDFIESIEESGFVSSAEDSLVTLDRIIGDL